MTSCAPDTLKRSVIWLFISAFTPICSREIDLQPPTDARGRDDEQRQHDERQQREAPLEGDHRGQRGDEDDDVADDAAERAGDRGLRTDDVVVQTADQRAGLGAGEERDRHALHLGEQRDAQVVDESFADARAAPPLTRSPGPPRSSAATTTTIGEDGDQLTILVGDGVVEDGAERERRDQCDQRRQQDRHQEPGDDRRGTDGRTARRDGARRAARACPSPRRRRVA